MTSSRFVRFLLSCWIWAGMAVFSAFAQAPSQKVLRRIDLNPPPPSPITILLPPFGIDYMVNNTMFSLRTVRAMMHRDNALAAQYFEAGMGYRRKMILFSLAGVGLIGAGISQGFHKEGTDLPVGKKSMAITGLALGGGALIGGLVCAHKRTRSFIEAAELYNAGIGAPNNPPKRLMQDWYFGLVPNGGVGIAATF